MFYEHKCSTDVSKGEKQMKKKLLTAVLPVLMVLTITACGKKDTADLVDLNDSDEPEHVDSDLVYLKDFDASQYVELGDYKNIEISVKEPTVTEDELEKTIQYWLQERPLKTPVTDRTAELGDVANIDYEGKLDGVAFDGGTAEGYDLILGSRSFIPGFEDGVVGMEIGETKDLEISFPDPYKPNPDLSGKPVVFTVTLNSLSIQEPAELSDEFVAGLGWEGCSNVEEFRKYLHDNMLDGKKVQYEKEKENAIAKQLDRITSFREAPDGMVDRMEDAFLAQSTVYAQMYGVDVGTYVAKAYGGTEEDYEETLRIQAGLMAQRYIMLAAIAQVEGISVSDEELEEQLREEGYETTEGIDMEAYREYLLVEKTMDYLVANVTVNQQ